MSRAATHGQDRSSFNTEPGLRSGRFLQTKRGRFPKGEGVLFFALLGPAALPGADGGRAKGGQTGPYKNRVMITEISPHTPMAMLLMAPCTSPISRALLVPRAWLQAPVAMPWATGSSP